MGRIARLIRQRAKRKHVEPTTVMIDAQTVRGGRAGPTFHNAGGRGGRTIGAKRSILIEYLGLPLAVRVDPARPHDVKVGRELLASGLKDLPPVRDVITDRATRALPRSRSASTSASTSRPRRRDRAGSSRSLRSTGSSTPSHVLADGGDCLAVTRAPGRVPAPGSKSCASPTCSRGAAPTDLTQLLRLRLDAQFREDGDHVGRQRSPLALPGLHGPPGRRVRDEPRWWSVSESTRRRLGRGSDHEHRRSTERPDAGWIERLNHHEWVGRDVRDGCDHPLDRILTLARVEPVTAKMARRAAIPRQGDAAGLQGHRCQASES